MLQDAWRLDSISRNSGPPQMSPQGPSGEPRRPVLRDRACAADDGLVISSTRLLSQLAGLRPAARRALFLALAVAASATAISTGLTAPAHAVVSAGFGVQQRAAINSTGLFEGGPLDYHGGEVLHSSDAYVVYWDPIGNYRGDWERLIDRYFQDVGAASGTPGDVFALDGQYLDGHGRAANQLTFRGSYKDTTPYPPAVEGCNQKAASHVCLTDSEIKRELKNVVTSVAPPLPGASGTPVYYLLTPPGVTVCTGTGSPGTCSNSAALEKESEAVTAGEVVKTGICGYHSTASVGGVSPVPYVVQPWVAGDAGLFIESFSPLVTSGVTPDVLACQDNRSLQEPNQLGGLNPFGNYAEGLADVIINDLSIEQRNVVTNPFLTAWYQTSTNAEQGDMCQFNFGPPPPKPPEPNTETHAASLSNDTINGDSYYVSWAFDSADVTAGKGFGCWSGVTLEPFYTAPNPVNSGDIVGFNGTESDFTLAARTTGLPADEPYVAAVYTWNFGDGSAEVSGPTDASVFHSYQHGGTYNVTLTVTDSGGNTNSFTKSITVIGSGSSSSGSSPVTSPAAAGGSSSGSTPGSLINAIPGPVASAAVTSKSLRKALRNGLVVSYSVNEQVAGQFQVLLAASVAKRIGLHGPLATGMPPGSAPAIVIAKAILITTTGGRNTVKILFGKKTAAKLRKLRSVSLTIRLVVRNASSHSPLTTTVISAVTLSH
jgi:PKD domain